jgi:uncharacterized protein (UPF0276 family)
MLDAISKQIGASWCGEDVGIWNVNDFALPYFAPPLFDADIASWMAEQTRLVDNNCSVPFLVETPNCTFVAGELPLGDFFSRIVEQSNCKMVLDASHVYAYALAANKNAKAVLRSLPLDAVWEIHVAGGSLQAGTNHRYIDSHSDPILDPIIEVFAEAVSLCKNLRAVTYEIGLALPADTIAADFERLETVLAGFMPALDPR